MNKNTRCDLTAASIFLKISASDSVLVEMTFFLGRKSGWEDEENNLMAKAGDVECKARDRGAAERHKRRNADEQRKDLIKDIRVQ